MVQGLYQMGKVLGTLPPSSGNSDILAGELYLEFVPMDLGPGGSSERFETGVLHRISIPFIWAEWIGLGNHS